MLPVTAFFAGLLGFFFLGLSMLVIHKRITLRTAFGDGGDEALLRRIRAQGNFAEYVPLALVLMAVCELNHQSPGVLASLGGTLLLARASHAYSLIVVEARRKHDIKFRTIGVVLSFGVIGTLSLFALIGN